MKTTAFFTLLGLLCWCLQTWAQETAPLIPTEADLYKLYQQQVVQSGADEAKVVEMNTALIQEMNLLERKSMNESKRRLSISMEEATQVLDMMRANTVVNFEASPKYDPKGNIGFCFGRAMWAHIQLLRLGLDKDSIRKVFIVGPAKSGDIYWQFHVATMARAHDGQWLVIDTIPGKVLTLNDWYEDSKKFDAGKRRLFMADPKKFGADAGRYKKGKGALSDPFYNQYFDEMLKIFKAVPLKIQEKFKPLKAPSCKKLRY